jgi:hypothetical protein
MLVTALARDAPTHFSFAPCAARSVAVKVLATRGWGSLDGGKEEVKDDVAGSENGQWSTDGLSGADRAPDGP